jgi:hypothetical protein
VKQVSRYHLAVERGPESENEGEGHGLVEPAADRPYLTAAGRALAWFLGGAASVGGPLGAAVGGGLASAASDAFTRMMQRRLGRFRSDVAEQIDLADLVEAVAISPRVLDLLLDAIEGASQTEWEAKRLLLARAVAQAARDDAFIDEASHLIKAARAIEPPEARLLALLNDLPPPGHPADQRKTIEPSASREALRAQSPTPELLDRLLGTLIREGLARDVSGQYDGASTWGISSFGKRFLNWLEAAPEKDQE